jgi:hypothetical protein
MSIISSKNVRVGIWTAIGVGVLIAIKFGLHAAGFEFLAVNTLFSSAIGGAVFILGFLLAGIIADYKEAEKVPAELRASLENIVEEGRVFHLIKHEFDEKKIRIKAAAVIQNFFRGLSHEGNHDDLRPCLDSIDSFSDSFLEMEKLGMPPNYVTRLKTEQGNLRRIALRVYHMQRTQFIPSAHFLAMSLVGPQVIVVAFVAKPAEEILNDRCRLYPYLLFIELMLNEVKHTPFFDDVFERCAKFSRDLLSFLVVSNNPCQKKAEYEHRPSYGAREKRIHREELKTRSM